MQQSLQARNSLEEVLASSRKMEQENDGLKKENADLKARLVVAEQRVKKLRVFENIADDPPKQIQVFLSDPRVCQQLVATAVKFYGEALGDPDHSADEQTRKRARRNVRDIVEACILYGLQRFQDVRSLYMTYT